MRGRVLADVHACQVKLGERSGTFDRKAHTGGYIREPETELIQQPRRKGVGIGNQQAAVMYAVHVVRQEVGWRNLP